MSGGVGGVFQSPAVSAAQSTETELEDDEGNTRHTPAYHLTTPMAY